MTDAIGVSAARSPPDRPERGVPAPSLRTRRLRERDRSDLAGDGADAASSGPGPCTATWPIPTVTTDRFLREGDVIWVDSGITWQGYASDYGRTWITGRDPVPNAKQQTQFRRWRGVVDAALDVLKPGVSALELGTAAIDANDGVRPWIDHFYLAHGVGTESAEMPLIGTDFGDNFDERLIMQPGMVLVFEPVIWEEGASRAIDRKTLWP